MATIYQFGKFALNVQEQLLTADGHAVHLPTKEFETLLMLVENNGKVRKLFEDDGAAVIGEHFKKTGCYHANHQFRFGVGLPGSSATDHSSTDHVDDTALDCDVIVLASSARSMNRWKNSSGQIATTVCCRRTTSPSATTGSLCRWLPVSEGASTE